MLYYQKMSVFFEDIILKKEDTFSNKNYVISNQL